MNKNIKPHKILLFAALFLLLLLYIAPFLLVLLNSMKPTREFLENPIKLPVEFNFNNYLVALEKMNFARAIMNTFIITTLSVALIVFFSSMTAYAFVRFKWRVSKVLFGLFVSAMLIPFQAIMIPLVRIYGSMSLLNSIWTLVFMYIGFGAPLSIFIYHGFIKSIPVEIEEAAMIDGCSRIQTFFRVVFPLLKPISFTVVILAVLWIWNDYLLPSLVLVRAEQRTLPLSIYYFYGTYTVDYGLLMAGLLMTVLPILVVYLFLQKYIIKGVIQGSIK